jgi:hypothetical protein
MGMTKINEKQVVTPSDEMKVSDLKELANVPEHEKLYNKQGHVLDDDEVVRTDHQEFGVVTDWERGRL